MNFTKKVLQSFRTLLMQCLNYFHGEFKFLERSKQLKTQNNFLTKEADCMFVETVAGNVAD